MSYLLPDRKAVAQIKYQLKRFEKQCAELPEATRAQLRTAMEPLLSMLQAVDEAEGTYARMSSCTIKERAKDAYMRALYDESGCTNIISLAEYTYARETGCLYDKAAFESPRASGVWLARWFIAHLNSVVSNSQHGG